MLEKRFKHVNPCLWLVSQTRGVQRGLNRGCYALPSSFGVWDTTNRIQKVAWRPKIKRYDFNWFQVLVGRQYYIRIITYTVTVLNSIHICSTYIYIDRCVCVCVCVCGMSSRSMISLLTFVAVLRCLLRSRMRRWISCSSVWSRTGNCLRLAGCLAIRHIPPVCWLLVHCVSTEKIDVVSSSPGGHKAILDGLVVSIGWLKLRSSSTHIWWMNIRILPVICFRFGYGYRMGTWKRDKKG